MFGTVGLYILTYSTLHTHACVPESMASTSSPEPLSPRVSELDTRSINRAARYMIIYPTVYMSCTLPLAAGRMVAMTGQAVPYRCHCIAGAAITSCGWLDVLIDAFTHRVLVFSDAPPPIDECGIETFGIFHSLEGFWNVTTVVEGGVLVDPTVSTRRRKHNKKFVSRDRCSCYGPRGQDGAMDDTFDLARPGTITTKTTVIVTTEPRTPGLSESAKEVRFPANRPTSKAAQIPSEHNIANGTRGAVRTPSTPQE
jgi:hypothetical protein